MAVRFILGRAGCGKTHHCLEAVRQRLRHDPIDGPRLILLVPEQAALQTERAILAPPDITCAHRVDVLSFQRLALKILESTAAADRRAITDTSRVMVLRHLVARHARRLRFYRRLDRVPGFIDQLSATIRELMQEAVDPNALAELVERASGDELRSAKLHDLHLIFSAYLTYLGPNLLDPCLSLQVARERMHQCHWLHGAEVWVDGFASYMRQELLTLVELARLGSHCELTLLTDPALVALDGQAAAASHSPLFARTLRTHAELRRAFSDAGLAIHPPLVLDPHPAPRFRESPPLAQLERRLFAPLPPDIRTTGPALGPPEPRAVGSGPGLIETPPVEPRGSVNLVELPSRRVEVEYAVAQVLRWVRVTGLRYRDIAIMARDLGPYHDLLSAALAARGVPFFIDRRRTIAHHPLVELLRAGVMLAVDDWSLESLRLLLKSDLLPLSSDERDALENHLLAQGIKGVNHWRADWIHADTELLPRAGRERDPRQAQTLAQLNELRRRILGLLDPWFRSATTEQLRTGDHWTRALVQWLEHLGVGARIEQWAKEATHDGHAGVAAEHEQVWRDVSELLDDLTFAFAETPLRVDELAEVLDAGLSKLTVGLVPPTLDQVLVGAVDRSRHPDIKAAVIIGFNDGAFPQRPTEDSILHDADRGFLTECGLRVAPPTRELVLDEALLVYIAFTRASRELLLTSTTSDDAGKPVRPSPFIEPLRTACPSLSISTLDDPAVSGATWDILTTTDLATRVVGELRRSAQSDESASPRAQSWRSIYESMRMRLMEHPPSRFALSALAPPQPAKLSRHAVGRLYPDPLRSSVSQLETFAACPFKFFAEHALALKERPIAKLEPSDAGTVMHAVLDAFVRSLCNARRGFNALDDAETVARLREACLLVGQQLPAEGVVAGARHAYLLRRAADDVARALQTQRRVAAGGRFQPRSVELPFGFGDDGLPALEITTPRERRVLLRGYIDRLDLTEDETELLATVIDYKRTADKTLSLAEVYYGLSLQLLGYLLAVTQGAPRLADRPIRPAAALYVSLSAAYQRIKDSDELGETSIGGYKLRGLISDLAVDALQRADGASGWSKYFSLFRTKEGGVGFRGRSDVIEPGEMDALLAHTRRKLAELADGILDGRIEVAPYRLGNESPCRWCNLQGVCRFEIGLNEPRYLESMKREQVLIEITKPRT